VASADNLKDVRGVLDFARENEWPFPIFVGTI
jgi:hypothetical protein